MKDKVELINHKKKLNSLESALDSVKIKKSDLKYEPNIKQINDTKENQLIQYKITENEKDTFNFLNKYCKNEDLEIYMDNNDDIEITDSNLENNQRPDDKNQTSQLEHDNKMFIESKHFNNLDRNIKPTFPYNESKISINNLKFNDEFYNNDKFSNYMDLDEKVKNVENTIKEKNSKVVVQNIEIEDKIIERDVGVGIMNEYKEDNNMNIDSEIEKNKKDDKTQTVFKKKGKSSNPNKKKLSTIE